MTLSEARESHGDEEYHEYTCAEEARIEREAIRRAEEKIADPLWWNDRMEGFNTLSSEVPTQLARCMRNLDQARRGESVALDAVTTALSILRRQARQDAMIEAREEAERALEAGDL